MGRFEGRGTGNAKRFLNPAFRIPHSVSLKKTNLGEIVNMSIDMNQVCAIARRAGSAIMEIYAW